MPIIKEKLKQSYENQKSMKLLIDSKRNGKKGKYELDDAKLEIKRLKEVVDKFNEKTKDEPSSIVDYWKIIYVIYIKI
jgi:hypothetical protein